MLDGDGDTDERDQRWNGPKLSHHMVNPAKQNRRPIARAAVVEADSSSGDARHVGRMKPLLAGVDLELHFLAFGETLEAVHLDRGEMDEHIFSVVLLNEAISLGVIEPLHLPSRSEERRVGKECR